MISPFITIKYKFFIFQNATDYLILLLFNLFVKYKFELINIIIIKILSLFIIIIFHSILYINTL